LTDNSSHLTFTASSIAMTRAPSGPHESAVGYSTGKKVAGRTFVLKLTSQRISAYKLGDFRVENRAYSSWTIKSDAFSGRQIRSIFA